MATKTESFDEACKAFAKLAQTVYWRDLFGESMDVSYYFAGNGLWVVRIYDDTCGYSYVFYRAASFEELKNKFFGEIDL